MPSGFICAAFAQESPRPHWTAFDKEDLRNKAESLCGKAYRKPAFVGVFGWSISY